MARDVYLVGSVPLPTTHDVFETVAAKFGELIKRIPDGEVGKRSDWITHLETLFRTNPAFEPSDEVFTVHAHSAKRVRYRLRPGVEAKDVKFGNLGYAENALASYNEFRRLRDAGKIAPGTRFQVDLVPAHSVIWLFVVEREQAAIDPVYNSAVLREMKQITDAIPHKDLAIQYDVASAVFARLERGQPSPYGRTKEEMVDCFATIIAGLSNSVPGDVELLFHFCYGDANHMHAIEPTDMADMVSMANALTRKINRPINLIHMPVPRDRTDDAYFRPLHDLHLKPETDLCLGLQRVAAVRKYSRDFAVATECGFGRRDPKTIPALMDLHVAVARSF
jgi:hypothetical protein